MVDLATLTGAIIVSLGHEYAGMFSNDDALAQKLLAAGIASGEKLWRMPLGEAYDKLIKSDIADMKNIGGRAGRRDHRGAVHAALRQQACPGRISTSPASPGAARTRRPCRRAPPRSACGCSTGWWPSITRS